MDVCTECGERTATIFISMAINGTQLDVRLCETCAAERTREGGIIFDIPVEDGAMDHATDETAPHPFIDPEKHPSVCPACGLTAEEFARTELLGCDVCYTAHADLLRELLTLVHGVDPRAVTPNAKARRRLQAEDRMRTLGRQLEEAVAEEQYLRAAELRDEISELRGRSARE